MIQHLSHIHEENADAKEKHMIEGLYSAVISKYYQENTYVKNSTSDKAEPTEE